MAARYQITSDLHLFSIDLHKICRPISRVMGKHLTPMEVCERLIGPPGVIGAASGLSDKAAYQWRRASTGRDAGEIPSTSHMRALLAYSAARGLGLTPDHLIWGADAAEIAAILEARDTPPPAFTTRRRSRAQMQVVR